MNEQLYIPKTLKVGYQKREDTYTKKLAYVIYIDDKGVLRKEKSWETWRDKKMGSDEFENKPMEGFVINRSGGGVRESYGWNARHEFVRVYHPHNFEFEISVANLLYILQESNSVKGKGLEGEFILAWAGTTLCLLPVSSPEYQKCIQFTKLQSQKISAKALVVGRVYETKKQEKLIYLGKLPWYVYKATTINQNSHNYEQSVTIQDKEKYIFVEDKKDSKYSWQNKAIYLRPLSGLTSLAREISPDIVPDFAEIMDKALKDKHLSMPDKDKFSTEPEEFKFDNYSHYGFNALLPKQGEDGVFDLLTIHADSVWEGNKYVTRGYKSYLVGRACVAGKSGYPEVIRKYTPGHRDNVHKYFKTIDEIKAEGFVKVFIHLKSKGKVKIEEYVQSYY